MKSLDKDFALLFRIKLLYFKVNVFLCHITRNNSLFVFLFICFSVLFFLFYCFLFVQSFDKKKNNNDKSNSILIISLVIFFVITPFLFLPFLFLFQQNAILPRTMFIVFILFSDTTINNNSVNVKKKCVLSTLVSEYLLRFF